MATIDDLIARLHEGGRLRVWSLAATFFGDAVAPRGGAVAMSDLSSHLERLGAEPGAIRTAMSRLARDGWVDRDRAGRKSYYRLAPTASEETRRASARIYAVAPPPWDGRWTVALAETGSAAADAALASAGYRRLAPGVWIAPDSAASPSLSATAAATAAAAAAAADTRAEPPDGGGDGRDIFYISGGAGAPPVWARALLSPPDLADRYRALKTVWDRFEPDRITDPAEAMAARSLLIHDWRRTLLRDAPLPRALRQDDWPGAPARDRVAEIYRVLAPASERWLDACEAGPGAAMPAAEPSFSARFGGL
ncbi:MAG: PaaX family transcriptional regulator C-terminal domain-containing protein [Pseudomonadota bacterium]